jgi:hypothetical protein
MHEPGGPRTAWLNVAWRAAGRDGRRDGQRRTTADRDIGSRRLARRLSPNALNSLLATTASRPAEMCTAGKGTVFASLLSGVLHD